MWGLAIVGWVIAWVGVAQAQNDLAVTDGLVVTAVPSPPVGSQVRLSQPYGRKGPTSLRHFPPSMSRRARPSPNPADPAGSRYLIKDRDLGQTFQTPPGARFALDAITLRVGPAPLGDMAGMAGAAGAEVFLQIFAVTGTPTIHDNGTTGATTVSVSYPGKAMADDYITGERYETLSVARGGRLPAELAVGESNTAVPTSESAGTLIRFDLTATRRVVLEPDRTYAFMVGFEHPAADRALPLDNYDYLNQPGVPDAVTVAGPYSGGHAIRREGRVEAPHANLALALSTESAFSAFPATFEQRLRQQPGTWGRPDVDTYRDLVFWLEGSTVGAPDVALSLVDRAPVGPGVIASYDGADTSGNTSVAHDTADIYKWSGASPFAHEDWGYFTPAGIEVPYIKRDRDLGQTFTHTGQTPARLRGITVRTGFGSNVVRPGTFGQPVSLQLFRVTGTPRVHDNGTAAPASALHGFPHDRAGQAIPAERDDYHVGEVYEPLAVLRGAQFPTPQAFGLADGARPDPSHPALRGRHLRFDVSGADVVLQPGGVYAFLILIDQAGDERGFTLANHYVGHYAGGHGIRRDGNGVFPPAVPDPARLPRSGKRDRMGRRTFPTRLRRTDGHSSRNERLPGRGHVARSQLLGGSRATVAASLHLELPLGLADEARRPGTAKAWRGHAQPALSMRSASASDDTR